MVGVEMKVWRKPIKREKVAKRDTKRQSGREGERDAEKERQTKSRVCW